MRVRVRLRSESHNKEDVLKESAGLNLGVRAYLQGASGSWNALRKVTQPPGEGGNAGPRSVVVCLRVSGLQTSHNLTWPPRVKR